jgi:hypothetical protein
LPVPTIHLRIICMSRTGKLQEGGPEMGARVHMAILAHLDLLLGNEPLR